MQVTKEEIAIIVANSMAALSTFREKIKNEDDSPMKEPTLGIVENKDNNLKSIIAILETEGGSTFGPLELHGLDEK